MTTHANGLISPPATEKALSTMASPPRVVIAGKTGRILCVADIRGDYHELNRLIREHEATAVIHTGDFGFLTADSLERMGDRILRHLVTYSPLIPPITRSSLLAIPADAGRAALIDALNQSAVHFPLSQFPHLLSGAITFPVPVFTVWGLIEDVRVLESFRTGEYEVHNLNVIDEATSRVLDVGGLKLRLFGLGGACVPHKLFDNGEGTASIAGGQGTMWATALQIGELVDTSDRVYDVTETRLLISSAPVSRNGLLTQLAVACKADLTISGGLHFRYPASYNDFAVHIDFEAYRKRLIQSRDAFAAVYEQVKDKVESNLSPIQKIQLKKAHEITTQIPTTPDSEESPWTNMWHWILSDASCGHMLLSVNDGRVSAETKSSGLNFSHRTSRAPAPPSAPINNTSANLPPARRPSAVDNTAIAKPTSILSRPNLPTGPSGNAPKPVANLPNAQAPTNKPLAQRANPTATPANPATIANPASASIPAKPVSQTPRQPRGPGAPSQAFAGNAQQKDRAEVKPAATGIKEKPVAPAKPAAPVANGKASPAPTAPTGPKAASDKSIAKPVEEKATSTSADTKTANGDKSAKVEDGERKSNDGETTPTEIGPTKKYHSLYLRNLPNNTTEDEIKSLFASTKDKIANVKIIADKFPPHRQKGFAYVDYDAEADQQEALANHTDTIRETTVSIVISNPPPPRSSFDFRGRGRGAPGFRGRGGAGRFPTGRSESKEGGITAGAVEKSAGGGSGEKKEGGSGVEKKATPAAKKD